MAQDICLLYALIVIQFKLMRKVEKKLTGQITNLFVIYKVELQSFVGNDSL